MKKKRIFLLLLQLFIASVAFAQIPRDVPKDVKEHLLKVKSDIKLSLDSCRTNYSSWYGVYLLSGEFNDGSIDLERDKRLNQLNLNWQMVFDDAMIKRVVQLLNNEYRKDELDTLVNRQMAFYEEDSWFEQSAMEELKLDTAKVFFHIRDSLDRNKNNELHPRPYQYYEVGLYLKKDTTARFKFLLDSVRIAQKAEVESTFLNRYNFNLQELVQACGYINDKRLVPPLIKLFEKAEAGQFGDDKMLKRLLTESLVLMKVEPYYSDCFAARSHSLQEIKSMEYSMDQDYLTYLFLGQESLLELSKYLQSSAFTTLGYQPGDNGYAQWHGKAYEDAFRDLKKYIENKDFWDIINAPDFELERDRFKIYDWMQKNYGKYEIKRVW